MTDAQVIALFDKNSPTSFGSKIATVNAQISSKYACANLANCTNTEIANLQWGSSGITLNPIAADPNYTPSKNTTMAWGAWPVYGATFPLEYYYFSNWFG
jgi:hypothetical protein